MESFIHVSPMRYALFYDVMVRQVLKKELYIELILDTSRGKAKVWKPVCDSP
jgi:hypothetical protein